METLKEIKVLKPENESDSCMGLKKKKKENHDFADVSDIFSQSHVNVQ